MTYDSKSQSPTQPDIAAGSPERFGYSWNIFNEILPIHEEQFRRWTQALPAESWTGRSILDVGCGIGRNSYWAMKWGASGGMAIDVDERSLAAARRNLATYPSLSVEHCSAYDIDQDDRFDIVFSIGVIHHLEQPDLALAQMVQAAKPGGTVLVWLYGHENNEWLLRWFDPIRRTLFGHAPLWLVFQISRGLTAALWLATARTVAHRIFPSYSPLQLSPSAGHRIRSDDPADCKALPTRGGDQPAAKCRPEERQCSLGERDVVVRGGYKIATPCVTGRRYNTDHATTRIPTAISMIPPQRNNPMGSDRTTLDATITAMNWAAANGNPPIFS